MLLCSWGILVLPTPAQQLQEVVDQSSEFEVVTVLSGLDNPAGLAVRKIGQFDLFLSESGAGRVWQLSTKDPEQKQEVITGFATNRFNNQLPYQVGPLSLAFLTQRSKLIVGNSGQPNGKDQLSVFTLPQDGRVLDAQADITHSLGPQRGGPKVSAGSVNFLGISRVDNAPEMFLSVGGDNDQGIILKAGIEANRLVYLKPFGGRQQVSSNPGGIARIPSPRPPFLVVGNIGSYDTPKDGSLLFFVPNSGELAMKLSTGLHDIMSIIYSPSGQLYVADFAWIEESDGGIYRIEDVRVDGMQGCRAVKIANVSHPMDMAFSRDGSLYVTAFGPGENEKQGALLKITGSF